MSNRTNQQPTAAAVANAIQQQMEAAIRELVANYADAKFSEVMGLIDENFAVMFSNQQDIEARLDIIEAELDIDQEGITDDHMD